VNTAAVAPDGLYMIALYANQYWQVVKVARAGSNQHPDAGN